MNLRGNTARLYHFLNPLDRVGQRNYSLLFPFLTLIMTTLLSEIFAYSIAKNPMAVGVYIIFIHVALLIYFSFRDGIRGGIVTVLLAILYYFYIINTRHYKGPELVSGVDTTIVLAILYFFIALIIGWLRQTIDGLIERESNERRRLQTILQQLPVGIIITDHNGIIQQTNRKLDQILGVRLPIGITAGKDLLIQSTHNGKDISPAQSPLAQVLTTGKPVNGKIFTLKRDDGKNVHVEVNAAPIHNRKGKIIAAASIINDITHQREMEVRKDDFINMASHELKTPLTSLRLYLDTLLLRAQTYNDPKGLKILKSIQYQTGRLQELVSDLLDVSRIQTGKLSFTKELFRLDILIEETVDGLTGSGEHAIVFSKKIPVDILADRFRIYQVVTNLLTNAMKYSSGKEKITISMEKNNGKVVVSVHDNGIGIAKDQQKKIFDRLYQVTNPKEKTFPGLGMGLYISKEIINRHRGLIWVESEQGKGATFFFTLPLQSSKKHRR